jgi:hypothetical protein
VGEGLALGLGLGEGARSDGLGVDRLVGVGWGLARRVCGSLCGVGLAVGDGVGAGESPPPDPVVVDAGATSR